ncbi:MAG: YceD family protein, partial [Clostridium paraputrificum]
YKVEAEPFYFEGDYIKPLSEVDVKGEVTSDNNIITIKAHVKVDLELKCSRCLDTFIYPIDIDIEERFTNDSEHCEDENVVFVKSDALDITEIVENSIISTLLLRDFQHKLQRPMPSCGANLNKKHATVTMM